MHTVIIGAGIVGAAIACRMAEAGQKVTLMDAGGPGAGATGRSFGWVNASFYADEAHFRLRAEAIRAWDRLAPFEMPTRGCIWWEESGAALHERASRLSGLGYSVETLGSNALREQAPMLAAPPEAALFFPDEGAVDPVAAAQMLIRRASRAGADILHGFAVQAIDTNAGRVTGVAGAHGRLVCDRVIVAAGTATPLLVGPLGVSLPMPARPGLLMTTQPVDVVMNHVVVAPDQEFRQLPDGRILAPTSAGHQGDSAETIADDPKRLATDALDRLGELLGQNLRLDAVTLAMRPVPQDGLPVVGPCGPEGLFVAVMHSGVTLGPLMGELVADWLETGSRPALLSPYSPARFV